MSNIRTRTKSMGTSGTDTSNGIFHTGAAVILGLVVDYNAAADAGTVLTIRDGKDSSGTSVYAITGNTDIGTTVPVRLFDDADLVAGTSTANVGAGIVVADGIFVSVASDVTGPQTVTLIYKPLLRVQKSITIAGSAGSATGEVVFYNRPCIVHGIRYKSSQLQPSGADIKLWDGLSSSGNQISTQANIGNTTLLNPIVTTTGHDEGGNAVTTAATGAYANDGVICLTGLTVEVEAGDAEGGAFEVVAMLEV